MVNPASIPFSAVLVVMLVSAITASAAPAPSPAPPMIGMPGCDTRCGNMSVPYPFGMGSSHCYHSPGFNLTCDRRTDPPRLLLGDGTLQVVQDISEYITSVTVTRTSGGGDIEIDADGNGAFGGGISGANSPYSLSDGLSDGLSFKNELILTGCNVQATLKNAVDNTTISSCSSVCTYESFEIMKMVSSISCRSPVVNSKAGSAYHLHLDWFGANSSHDKRWPWRVLVASTGWFEQKLISDRWLQKDHPSKDAMAAPSVFLKWEVPFEQGDNMSSPTSPSASSYPECSEDEARNVCKSKHSRCYIDGSRGCYCKMGYTGNPYLADGCRGLLLTWTDLSHRGAWLEPFPVKVLRGILSRTQPPLARLPSLPELIIPHAATPVSVIAPCYSGGHRSMDSRLTSLLPSCVLPLPELLRLSARSPLVEWRRTGEITWA